MNLFDFMLNPKAKEQFSQVGQQAKQVLSPITNMGKSFAPQAQQSFQPAISALKTAGSNIIKPVKQEFDYQSKVQKSIDPYKSKLGALGITAESLDSMGLSDEEKKAVQDLYSEIGVGIPGLTDIKPQSQDILKNSSKREGFMQNLGGSIADAFGGAVSEVPAIAGNTASFIGKAAEYNPMVMLNQAIDAGFSDKTYGQIRDEQVAQNQQYADLGKQGKELIQQYGQFDPTTTSAKVGETVADIGASLIGPNKIGVLRKGSELLGAGKKLAMGAKIADMAIEGGLAGAKYDIGAKAKITPSGVITGAVAGGAIAGAPELYKGAKVLAKSIFPKAVEIPTGVSEPVSNVLKKIIPDSFTPTELENLKISGKIQSGKGITGNKNTYIPSKEEIKIAEAITPHVNANATTTENISSLRNAIKNEAESLKSAIASQNPIIPKRQVSGHIKNALDKIMENPEMTIGDNPKLVNKLIEKYKSLLDEEGGTALGVLNARQRFDSYIKNFRPKVFDAPTGGAYDSAVKEIRNSANSLLDSLVLNKSAKDSLRLQSQMFNAIDMFARNKDITKIGKILKNPITKIAGGAALGSAGVGLITGK